MPQTHHLDKNAVVYRWDRDAPAALTVDPGDTVVFETPEITRGQITPESTAEALLNLDFELIHQISGPVATRGAEPGDTLVVDIVEVKPKGWGYSFVLPGFNLLKDDPAFQTPFLMHWDLTGSGQAEFKPGIVVPFEPFCRVMGLAPGEPGPHSTVPPRRVGAISTSGSSSPARRSPSPSRLPVGSSPAATATLRRAMGRSVAPASRWKRPSPSASICARASTCAICATRWAVP
jgi:signal peptidase I